MLGGRKTVIFEFLGTGMISVMPVPFSFLSELALFHLRRTLPVSVACDLCYLP